MMLKPKTPTSFYLDDRFVDIKMLKYEARNCGAGLIHHRNQTICKIQLFARELYTGYNEESEAMVRTWLREL